MSLVKHNKNNFMCYKLTLGKNCQSESEKTNLCMAVAYRRLKLVQFYFNGGSGSHYVIYIGDIHKTTQQVGNAYQLYTVVPTHLPKHLLRLVCLSMKTLAETTFPKGINICKRSWSPNSCGRWQINRLAPSGPTPFGKKIINSSQINVQVACKQLLNCQAVLIQKTDDNYVVEID